ncbi:hypothetical protein HYU45_01655 [Candidatus Daviesbacteria bacterium]|nr:hypothetical protein [Candidatus Daviesbacteria bacterium]
METVPPPNIETLKQPTKAQLFEHLFPGNKFKDLSPFNPLNIPSILRWIYFKDRVIDISKAFHVQQGYADRSDFQHLDQLSVALEFLNPIAIVKENPLRFKGWVADLLKDGEQLGGLAVQQYQYVPQERLDAYARSTLEPKAFVDWVKHGFRNSDEAEEYLRSFYESVSVKVIGILGSDGKPNGLIRFIEGPRPRNGERVKSPSLVGNLVATSVKI